jgi:hypothetical protein
LEDQRQYIPPLGGGLSFFSMGAIDGVDAGAAPARRSCLFGRDSGLLASIICHDYIDKREVRAMGIFDTLKNAIFGGQPQAKPGVANTTNPQASPAAAPTSAATQGAAGAAAAAPTAPVDIEAVLNGMAAKNPEKLNWQSSIVDLMKLVDLDPSMSNRKELAGELGYTGDTQDSAKMNIWLHQQVMAKLAASGGKVPDSLRH